MASIKIWARVPDGSKLAVWVTVTAGKCIAAARFREENGTNTDWIHSDLVPGPKERKLRSPNKYAVTVRILFTADGSAATIHAQIVKPNGDIHGNVYDYDAQGDKGDDERALIVAQTEQ